MPLIFTKDILERNRNKVADFMNHLQILADQLSSRWVITHDLNNPKQLKVKKFTIMVGPLVFFIRYDVVSKDILAGFHTVQDPRVENIIVTTDENVYGEFADFLRIIYEELESDVMEEYEERVDNACSAVARLTNSKGQKVADIVDAIQAQTISKKITWLRTKEFGSAHYSWFLGEYSVRITIDSNYTYVLIEDNCNDETYLIGSSDLNRKDVYYTNELMDILTMITEQEKEAAALSNSVSDVMIESINKTLKDYLGD